MVGHCCIGRQADGPWHHRQLSTLVIPRLRQVCLRGRGHEVLKDGDVWGQDLLALRVQPPVVRRLGDLLQLLLRQAVHLRPRDLRRRRRHVRRQVHVSSGPLGRCSGRGRRLVGSGRRRWCSRLGRCLGVGRRGGGGRSDLDEEGLVLHSSADPARLGSRARDLLKVEPIAHEFQLFHYGARGELLRELLGCRGLSFADHDAALVRAAHDLPHLACAGHGREVW
mmetsp:Transcript_46603/g.134879  ORF Transcript_46603/g.134879 Transcript_46603/m.134879 type:complete len:224 (+) Transcript_46603:1040-1711(+)